VATSGRCSRAQHDLCSTTSYRCSCSCHAIELPDDLPFIDLSTPDWHTQAACASPTVSQETFYVDAGGRSSDEGSDLTTTGRAQRICSRCPVRRSCLRDALTHETAKGSSWGVWGGVSPDDRHDPAIRDLPLSERLDILEARFREQAARWLTPTEEIAT
jgi:hypothetical protein